MSRRKFWEDGVRFECQGTGRCCMSRGKYGYVYLTLTDRRRMSRALGLSVAEFTRKHCARTDGWHHLKDPEKDCQFLEGKRCGVYEGRPAQCRTWPFWPENMNSRAWSQEVVPYCPGVGKGRLYEADEIRALMRRDPLADG